MNCDLIFMKSCPDADIAAGQLLLWQNDQINIDKIDCLIYNKCKYTAKFTERAWQMKTACGRIRQTDKVILPFFAAQKRPYFENNRLNE